MGEIVNCKNVCEECPLRDGYEGTPEVIVEIGWTAFGSHTYDARGGGVSFEMSYGKPVGERASTVVLGGMIKDEGIRRMSKNFGVLGSQLDSGAVSEALDACSGPVEKRVGLLKLKKVIGCGAIKLLDNK